MSKIEGIEQFIECLDYEISLRKRQLIFLNDILNTLSENNLKFSFIRMSIPEIYAHYEGFSKFCFNSLIDYLVCSGIENKDIDINYLIFSLVTHLETHILSSNTKTEKMLDIFKEAFKNNKAFLNIANIDKYNLNHDNLENTLSILGINSSDHNLSMNSLGVLYSRRNEIAHGQLQTGNQFSISRNKDITSSQVNIALSTWRDDYNCVLETLDSLKNMFIDYVQNRRYAKLEPISS